MFYVDDGISETSFERNDFQQMHPMAEEGKRYHHRQGPQPFRARVY